MSLFLGIDPGKKGALAVLDADAMTVEVHDMPGTTRELHDLISGLPLIKGCVLEKLFTGPVMGRAALATMFTNYGILSGALAWRDIPFAEVPSNKWKPAMDLSKDKTASREMAMRQFPDQSDLFKRVKDDGRAEAALIALYAAQSRRKWAA